MRHPLGVKIGRKNVSQRFFRRQNHLAGLKTGVTGVVRGTTWDSYPRAILGNFLRRGLRNGYTEHTGTVDLGRE